MQYYHKVTEDSQFVDGKLSEASGMFSHSTWYFDALVPSRASGPSVIYMFNNNNLIVSLTLLLA